MEGARVCFNGWCWLPLIQIWWYFIWNFNKRKTLHLIPKSLFWNQLCVFLLLFEKCFCCFALLCIASHRLPIELIEWCLEQIFVSMIIFMKMDNATATVNIKKIEPLITWYRYRYTNTWMQTLYQNNSHGNCKQKPPATTNGS